MQRPPARQLFPAEGEGHEDKVGPEDPEGQGVGDQGQGGVSQGHGRQFQGKGQQKEIEPAHQKRWRLIGFEQLPAEKHVGS